MRRHQVWLAAALATAFPAWGMSFQLLTLEPVTAIVTLPVLAAAAVVAGLGLPRDPVVGRWLTGGAWLLLVMSVALAGSFVGPSPVALVFIVGPVAVVWVVRRMRHMLGPGDVPLPPLPD